jgi:hypothetical protein
MALKTTITSQNSDNEISVFTNEQDRFTIFIQDNTDYVSNSVFCFDDIEDAEDFIKIFKKELSLYKKNV